jgi:SAM-dependent methyltransferase
MRLGLRSRSEQSIAHRHGNDRARRRRRGRALGGGGEWWLGDSASEARKSYYHRAMEHRPPCCCGANRFERLAGYSRYMGLDEPPWGVVRCSNCGLVTRTPSLFVDAAPVPPSTRQRIRATSSWSGGGDAAPPHLRARLAKAYGLVPRRSVLDVGAGTGAFLILARQLGWEVAGTELNPQSAVALDAHAIPLFTQELEVAPIAEGSFGMINMNHVLEHVRSPLETLRAARHILMPDGLLVVEVPNELYSLGGLARQALRWQVLTETTCLQHEWFFTKASLASVVSAAGFDRLEVGTPYLPVAGRPIRSMFSFFASAGRAGDVIVAWARRPCSVSRAASAEDPKPSE